MNDSVIILSCVNNFLLGPLIEACVSASITVEGVIMDGELSAYDQENVRKRLNADYRISVLSNFDYPDIPFYFVKDHNSKGVVRRIAEMKSDYIINGGTPRILKKDILSVKKGALNCHPGLLPEYRGCTCMEWAIYNDDPVGATVYFMDEGIDTGPIVMRDVMAVPSGQPYEAVRTGMIDFIAGLMARGVKRCYDEGLVAGKLTRRTGGQYFKPIPNDKLEEVKKKLKSGLYKCG